MKDRDLSLVDFKSDIERLFTAVIRRGFDKMEPGDLGDMLGRLIVSDVKNMKELEELYEELCNGIHHGIGLSHEHINSRESVEKTIENWSK
jgi:hypothetical protein